MKRSKYSFHDFNDFSAKHITSTTLIISLLIQCLTSKSSNALYERHNQDLMSSFPTLSAPVPCCELTSYQQGFRTEWNLWIIILINLNRMFPLKNYKWKRTGFIFRWEKYLCLSLNICKGTSLFIRRQHSNFIRCWHDVSAWRGIAWFIGPAMLYCL